VVKDVGDKYSDREWKDMKVVVEMVLEKRVMVVEKEEKMVSLVVVVVELGAGGQHRGEGANMARGRDTGGARAAGGGRG
jgi:hypothetical protein